MGASKIDILNSALVRMGAEPILSEDDGSARARIVKTEYPFALAMLTRSHPWRHATGYSQLAQITPKPAEIFDLAYVYQLPTDCLRMLANNLGRYEKWTEIAGGMLACDNSGPLSIKYVRLITDSDKFGANFIEALIWLLAKNCCYAITKRNSDKRAPSTLKSDYSTACSRTTTSIVGGTDPHGEE
jgi:hypothetical protein